MAKNIIRTTFRGDLSSGVVSNIQIIERVEYLDDDGAAIATKDIPRAATLEELGAIVTPAVAELGTANATLTEQNAALQAAVLDLRARLETAVLALAAVAHADTSWDNGVRAAVSDVLAKEIAE